MLGTKGLGFGVCGSRSFSKGTGIYKLSAVSEEQVNKSLGLRVIGIRARAGWGLGLKPFSCEFGST